MKISMSMMIVHQSVAVRTTQDKRRDGEGAGKNERLDHGGAR